MTGLKKRLCVKLKNAEGMTFLTNPGLQAGGKINQRKRL